MITRAQSVAICVMFCVFSPIGRAQETVSSGEANADVLYSVTPTRYLRKGLAAWPKIDTPRTPAVDRANAILSAMNQAIAKALRDCDNFYRQSQGLPESSHVQADWDRTVTVTMRGPRFVAMRTTETSFCGGAYPENEHAAVVFDMATGALVDWGKVFAAAGASSESDTTGDGANNPEISLHALTTMAVERAHDPDCKRALADSGELVFQVWPDAKRGELMVQSNGLPHVSQACEEPIGLSRDEAKKLGVSEEVLQALAQAHRMAASSRKR